VCICIAGVGAANCGALNARNGVAGGELVCLESVATVWRTIFKYAERSDEIEATVEIGGASMKMARVILFTGQIDAMSKFYGEVLGLKQVTNEKGWREFAAGGARIALHSGPSSPGRKGPKIVFYAKDVAVARKTLVARGARFGAVHETLVEPGARFGKVRQGEMFCLCNGKDPDGNPIQLSNR
jgi:catechol 2,3-dioxygenase-like lactoylglutathione lyase family enzyme